MTQIVLNIKDSRKADILLSFLADLEYVDAKPAERKNTETRSQWLKRLHMAVDASMDEVLPLVFRSADMRPPVNFAD